MSGYSAAEIIAMGNRRDYPHPHDHTVRVIDTLDEDGRVVSTRNVENDSGLRCYERIGRRVTIHDLAPQYLPWRPRR